MKKTFWKILLIFIGFIATLIVTIVVAKDISNFDKVSNWGVRIIGGISIMIWQYFQFRLFIIYYEWKDDKSKKETKDGK